jgi:hypothetical protein
MTPRRVRTRRGPPIVPPSQMKKGGPNSRQPVRAFARADAAANADHDEGIVGEAIPAVHAGSSLFVLTSRPPWSFVRERPRSRLVEDLRYLAHHAPTGTDMQPKTWTRALAASR